MSHVKTVWQQLIQVVNVSMQGGSCLQLIIIAFIYLFVKMSRSLSHSLKIVKAIIMKDQYVNISQSVLIWINDIATMRIWLQPVAVDVDITAN